MLAAPEATAASLYKEPHDLIPYATLFVSVAQWLCVSSKLNLVVRGRGFGSAPWDSTKLHKVYLKLPKVSRNFLEVSAKLFGKFSAKLFGSFRETFWKFSA